MAPTFRLCTLGTLALERGADPERVETLQRGGRPLLLLAWLLSREPRAHARAQLAELFWPGESAERSRRSLRQAVVVLRRLLGPEVLEADRERLTLHMEHITDDRRTFLECAERDDPDGMLQQYRGPFLASVDVGRSTAIEHWIVGEQERLRRRLLETMERAVARAPTAGEPHRAVALARRAAAAEPDDPRFALLLVDALVGAGARVDAREELDRIASATVGDATAETTAVLARLRRLADLEGTSRRPEQRRGTSVAFGERVVGREPPIAAVLSAVEAARDGWSRSFEIIGAAGSGKTRVLDELEVRARWRGSRVVRVRLLPEMQEVEWVAAAEVARALCGIPAAIGVRPESAAILVRLLPELSSRFPGAPSAPSASRTSGREVESALAELLETIAEDRVTLLLVDDDQWSDPASRRIWARLRPRVGTRLVSVFATRSPDPDPARERHVVHLPPFGAAEVRELLQSVGRVPDAGWSGELCTSLAELGRGNPRAVIAALRSLERARALALVDGAWRAEMDGRVRSHVADAIESAREAVVVSEAARMVVSVLALWRRPLREELVATVVGAGATRGVGTLADAMRELEASGLVRIFGPMWCIADDLTADGIVERRSREELAWLHAALLRAHVDGNALDAEALAHLALLCGRHALRSEARGLVAAASADRSLRAVGLYGRALARRVAMAAGQPTWEPELYGSMRWTARRGDRALLRIGALAAGALALVLWGATMLRPRLVLESEPMGELGGRATVDLVVQPRVGVVNGFGTRLEDFGGVVRASALHGRLVGDTVIAFSEGRAQFERLSIVEVQPLSAGASGTGQPRIVLDAGWWVRGVETGIRGVWARREPREFRVVRLVMNGRPVDATRPILARAPGDSLRFIMTFEYTTVSATANYVVAAGPSWIPPREGTIRLAGLPRPVERAWRTVAFAVPAPTQPGTHFVLIAVGAEDSAEHLMSATNWAAGAPVWGDGNDLVEMRTDERETLRASGRLVYDRFLLTTYRGNEGQTVVGTERRERPRAPSPGIGSKEIQGAVIEVVR